MKPRRSLPVVVALGLLLVFVATESAEAVVRVYNVSFGARGAVRPRAVPAGNSFARSGYLIFDTVNPANSVTIEVFRKTKTFQVGTIGSPSNLWFNIFPSQIGLIPADLNNDTITDREIASIGFQFNGQTSSRVVIGSVPRNGFRIGNTTFFQTAKVIGGFGSLTVPLTEHYSIRERWAINSFSASNPVNTNAGASLVTVYLVGRGWSQIL